MVTKAIGKKQKPKSAAKKKPRKSSKTESANLLDGVEWEIDLTDDTEVPF